MVFLSIITMILDSKRRRNATIYQAAVRGALRKIGKYTKLELMENSQIEVSNGEKQPSQKWRQ